MANYKSNINTGNAGRINTGTNSSGDVENLKMKGDTSLVNVDVREYNPTDTKKYEINYDNNKLINKDSLNSPFESTSADTNNFNFSTHSSWYQDNSAYLPVSAAVIGYILVFVILKKYLLNLAQLFFGYLLIAILLLVYCIYLYFFDEPKPLLFSDIIILIVMLVYMIYDRRKTNRENNQ